MNGFVVVCFAISLFSRAFGRVIIGDDCTIAGQAITPSEFAATFECSADINHGGEGSVSLYFARERKECRYAVKKYYKDGCRKSQHEQMMLSSLSDSPYFPKCYGRLNITDDSHTWCTFIEFIEPNDLLRLRNSVSAVAQANIDR